MPEDLIGKVSDFFARPVVAAVTMEGNLKIGDKVRIKGHSTDMEFAVESMQINNAPVLEVNNGDDVGIKVPDRVHRGDSVYKIID